MINPLRIRLHPPSAPRPTERDTALEGLRGSCALLVFVAHLVLPFRVLDPTWSPPGRFMWLNLGYPAVLMFFVLSGYVIGLVTTGPATSASVRHYLINRAARLVPVNTVVVLVCGLLLTSVDFRTVLGNVLFLQNYDPYPVVGSIAVLENNPNLWSLNYELVYYLGFIVLWVWAPSAGLVAGGLALVIGAHVAGLPVPLVAARYACGAFYWLAGLYVAWAGVAAPTPRASKWPAAALLAYAIWTFAPLRGACIHWSLGAWLWAPPTPVSPHRLDFLPAGILLLLTITGRAPAWHRPVTIMCLALGAAGLAMRALMQDWSESDTLALIALAAAIGLLRRNVSLQPLRWLAPLGSVSYGLYAIAAPLQLGQRALFPGFSGSWLTYTGRLVGVVALVAGATWLLERRIAPPISRWIRRWAVPRPPLDPAT